MFPGPPKQKDHKAKHGLYRSLVNNMVVGVSEGYTIQQELVGVGYRAEVKNGNTAGAEPWIFPRYHHARCLMK